MINLNDDSPQTQARTLAQEWNDDAHVMEDDAMNETDPVIVTFLKTTAGALRDCARELARELG